MLSKTDDTPPTPPARLNFAEYVLRQGRHDKIALAVVGTLRAERWSYERLRSAVVETAAGLLERGVVPGDRVLIRIGNTVDFPIVHLGAAWMGAIPIPTASGLTVPEVERIASEASPVLTVATPGIAVPGGPIVSPPALRTGGTAMPHDSAADDPAYIVYTSGTSGHPRGVVHAHRAVWARRMMHGGWYGLSERDRLLHAGAFNWTYTLGTGVLDPLSVGATALIPAEGTQASQLPLLLRRHGATIFAAAPGVYRRMLRTDALDLPDLRHGLSAGEKLPEVTRRRWEEATGTRVHEAFGMTECSTFISGSPDRPAPFGSSGYPQPGRRVAVLGPDGPVPRGAPGIIAIDRSDPGLMLGYLGAEDESLAKHDGEWFLTGDTGSMSAAGAITYLGRDDDMMNAGGFRVSPLEVEAAFDGMTSVCAAVERRLSEDTSIIALCFEGDVDESELRALAGSILAPHKRPRLYERREVPRNANGKLNRRALRSAP